MPLCTPDPAPIDVPVVLAELEEKPREFRLAWRWRRLLWLAGLAPLVYLAGIIAIHTLVLGLPLAPQSRQDFWLKAVDILLPSLLSAWFFHKAWAWRIRIDSDGISWRRHWRWRRWTWHDFEAGRIQRPLHSRGLYFLGRRWLEMQWLALQEFHLLNSICLAFWTPPSLELPDQLKVKVNTGILKRTRLRMHGEGVDIVERRRVTAYSWSDVRVQFLRLDGRHPAFLILHVVIPEDAIRLLSGLPLGPNWKGADAIHISAFLKRRLAPEQVEEATIAWPPKTRLDVEMHREGMEVKHRNFKIVGFAMVVLITIGFWVESAVFSWTAWILLGLCVPFWLREAYVIPRLRRTFAEALSSFDEQ